MGFINIELKARCNNPEEAEFILMQENAEFKGIDYQTDTYFNVATGRMKLREGNIEQALIHYERKDQPGPKASRVTLFKTQRDSALKEILGKALGVLIVVKKERKIFYIGNVKFHIDRVAGLGNFMEIEATDPEGTIGKGKLRTQCDHYFELLDIGPNDLVAQSYSDLLLNEKK